MIDQKCTPWNNENNSLFWTVFNIAMTELKWKIFTYSLKSIYFYFKNLLK